jgi:hypothetical protein
VNRQQIIALLVALAIVGLVGAIIQGQNARRYYRSVLEHEARSIGEEIVTTTNATRLVIIGPSLQSRLLEFAGAGAGVSRISFGDEPGLGDGSAEIRLYLTNAIGAEIGIRLKRVEEGKFHVLGFWTPSPPSKK